MGRLSEYSLAHRARQGFIALVAVMSLLMMTTTIALASSVTINDQTGVLNRSSVQNAASSLSYPVVVYAVANFSGSNSAFDQQAKSYVSSNNIVIAFTNHHHVAIVYGKNVPLSTSQAQDAVNSFAQSYRSSQSYTNATVSALNSLSGSLQSGNSVLPGVGGGAKSAFSGTACCIGLLVLGLILFFVFRRRSSGFGNRFNRRNPNNYPNNYPYDPNYPSGYPPQQGGGMNPWAAGGLGAAAGGFLGYELGKQAGERERDDNGGFGGGASGDFGGGDNGGFGGGASGDFGGGDNGGFFGGGGDFGGGDFGGGAGGDF